MSNHRWVIAKLRKWGVPEVYVQEVIKMDDELDTLTKVYLAEKSKLHWSDRYIPDEM